MAFTEEMHIDCPSTTVFDLMADARNETRWNGSVSRAELMTDEPIGKGSQFIVVNRGREDEATITVFDRPERLEFAVTSKAMDMTSHTPSRRRTERRRPLATSTPGRRDS